MKRYLSFLLLITSFNLYSQIKYEEGYIVDNSGRRTAALILNKDWQENPSGITYKHNDAGEVFTAGVEEIKEFGIGNYARYQRHRAAIDQSSGQIKKMSSTAEPNFKEDVVFLKQLVEGKVDLFTYRKGTLIRFFYIAEDGKPVPLVYKKYKQNNKVAENNSFRQELYSNLNCSSITADGFRSLQYSEEDLIQYFVAYNACEKADVRIFAEERTGKFNFYLKGGMQFASITVERGLEAEAAEFSFDPGIIFGLEVEYVLPFNRNKWALFLEPTYQSHKVERQLVNNTPFEFNDAYLTMDLQFISSTVGVRHYLFLNEASKLFVNAGVSFDLPINTQILLDRGDRFAMKPELTEVTNQAYSSVGLGYSYSNRLSAEVRYYFSKNISGDRTVADNYILKWDSNLNSVAIIIGYRLF